MRNFLVMMVFCVGFASDAQSLIQGRITDKRTNEPLAGASLFVVNTTSRAIADDAGNFTISVPDAKYRLVVTYVGYETVVIPSEQLSGSGKAFEIQMEVETNQIREVKVLSAAQRDRYRKLFIENLVGTSSNAAKCRVLNINDVNFEYNDSLSFLEATCEKPLTIENPELNYKITFLLSFFRMDFKNNLSFFSGYPVYEDLVPITDKNRKKVTKNRDRAFKGSSMHFLRSVYREQMDQEGFLVNSFSKRLNPEYPSADSLAKILNWAKINNNHAILHQIPPKYITKQERLNLRE